MNAVTGDLTIRPGVVRIQADEAACLRRRLAASPCQRCRQACRQEAISYHGSPSLPLIDQNRCTACGSCVATCPAEALTFTDIDIDVLLASRHSQMPRIVSCPRSVSGMPGEHILPCLASLCLEELIHLHLTGSQPTILNTRECPDCVNYETVHAWAKNVKRVAAGLTPLKHAGLTLAPVTNCPEDEGPKGRRAFIVQLTGVAGAAAKAAMPFRGSQPSKKKAFSDRVETRRNRLLRQTLDNLEEGAAETVATLCTYRLQVSGNCRPCSRCSGICPTGALRAMRTGEQKIFSYDPLACSGCGLCISFCTREALFLRPPALVHLEVKEGGNALLFLPVHRKT